MIMVIDIGNTHTVIGIFTGDELTAHWRMSTEMSRTSDETWIIVKMWCKELKVDMQKFAGVVISSVVPSQIITFSQMSRQRMGVDPMVINSDILLNSKASKNCQAVK